MTTSHRAFVALILAALIVAAPGARQAAGPFAIEGARLVVGDGTVVESGSIVVDKGRIVSVAPTSAAKVPASARRVDGRGKTIVPALVDGHVHLGFQVGLTFSADNYTRATLIDQLNRYQYAGIAAVLSMGTDAGEMPLKLRADQAAGSVGGARFLLAGRGLAAPNAGPATPELKPTAYGVETEAQGRQFVRDLVAQHVNVVKIWVDDRNGTVQKLSPPLYRAIIDEAHKHQVKVVAHVFYLDDAKELARAGVDAFAHLVRDKDVDAELIGLLKTHRILVMPNMAISENAIHSSPPAWLDEPLVNEVVPADEIARVRASYAQRSPDAVARGRRTFEMMQRSLAAMNAAGVTIGFGTDDGAVRDHFYVFTAHRELRLMGASGMTPAQVLTAATRTTAAFLGLKDLGSLQPGMSADFVVLDANPLVDLKNSTAIAAVYARGVPLDRAAMRAAFR